MSIWQEAITDYFGDIARHPQVLASDPSLTTDVTAVFVASHQDPEEMAPAALAWTSLLVKIIYDMEQNARRESMLPAIFLLLFTSVVHPPIVSPCGEPVLQLVYDCHFWNSALTTYVVDHLSAITVCMRPLHVSFGDTQHYNGSAHNWWKSRPVHKMTTKFK